jgi:mycothiol synthase
VTIQGFTAADTEALLAVNAAAFAHHPDQGHMTTEDFRERTSEPWFDPEGLFVAKDQAGQLLGFHWTKVHSDEDPPYGEVYVVAVNPRAAGRGLGRVLTDVGLRHLAGTGVERVILYVDGDNEPAIALYSGFGFHDVRTEAQYRGRIVRPES